MRLILLCGALLRLVSVAKAQSELVLLGQLPSCATACLSQFIPDTHCIQTDFACLCSNAQFLANSTICITGTCTIKEALTAQNVSAQLCHAPVRDRSLEPKLVGPILCGVAFILVTIRIITRRPFISDLFGWDDGLIVLAFLAAVVMAVTQVFLGFSGMGKDIWIVSFDEITRFLHWFYVGEVFYILSTSLLKLSILAFYLRVFPPSRFTRGVQTVIALTAAIGTVFLFTVTFQCWPVSYSWTRWSGETAGKCLDLNTDTWVNAAVNIVLDLVVLILPLPTLFKLQLSYSWRKKLRICLMFSVGLVVTIVSILRLRTLIVFANTSNATFNNLDTAIWSIIEATVGVICACMPAAKVFLTKTAPGWLGITTARNKYAGGTPAEYAVARKRTSTDASGVYANNFSRPATKTPTFAGATLEEDDPYRRDFMPLRDLEMNKTGAYRIGQAG